ncbi:MAG: SDR family oxidoreductase [Candidatus Glassbacteria bacterium]
MSCDSVTLVTGANGHIGSHIVRKLLSRGRKVRALVRPTSDLRSLEGLEVDIVRGDVLKPDSLSRAVEGCDVVYHTAAVYALWVRDESVISRTAIEGSVNVISSCSHAGVGKIIYTSSAAAIGLSDSPALIRTEEDYNADDGAPTYVTAKTESEKVSLDAAHNLGVGIIVVNPTLVLGPGDYKPTPSNALVKRFVKSGSPFFYEGGANVVDVEDVAEGHLLAEERGRDGVRYILGGDNVTIEDLLGALAELTGRTRPRLRIGRGAALAAGLVLEATAKVSGRPPLFSYRHARTYTGRYGYYDTSRARTELGYRYRSYEEVLKRTVDWFRREM